MPARLGRGGATVRRSRASISPRFRRSRSMARCRRMIVGCRMQLGAPATEPPPGPCWLGVRPEHLTISSSASEDAIPARILAVTPIHEKAVLLLRLTDGTEWLAALPPDAPDAASTTPSSSASRPRRRCCSIVRRGFASAVASATGRMTGAMIMGMLELRNVDKVYQQPRQAAGSCRAISRHGGREGRDRRAVGIVGLRQDLDAAHDRRFRGASPPGRLRCSGRRIDELPPARRKFAMAFEGYSLYPPLTVRENIAFALKSQQLSRAEVTRRVDAIAQLVEIEDILESYPRAISGGQQQRVSLARALVRDADLYLLDEPMGQLEPQLRAVLRGRIKSLLAEREHDGDLRHPRPDRGQRAGRPYRGHGRRRAAAIRQRKELKDRPANLFVASFIGEPPMNLLMRRCERSDGGFRLSVDAAMWAWKFPAATLDDATQRRSRRHPALRIGIRPQKIRSGPEMSRVRVVSNQWLGDQSHVAGDCDGHLLIAVARPDRGAAGEIVPFAIEQRHLHIFGPDGPGIRHAEVP